MTLTRALAGHFPQHVLARWGVGGRCDPPGVSTLSVVALCKKDQSIALDDYSRFVVYIDPRSIFDLVMTGQRSIFGKIDDFSTLQENSDAAMADIIMKPIPSCLLDK